MALYNDLPGVELTIKDGNLVLPAEPAGTERVLIIAQTKEEAVATPGKLDRNPKRVKESEDFNRLKLGRFDSANPLARRWKQVHDAGCRDIYVLPLTGLTAEEKYENLHQIYTVLEENFRADIILLDGVKVDTPITTAEVKLERLREDFIALGGAVKATALDAEETLEITDSEDEEGLAFPLTGPVITSTIEVYAKYTAEGAEEQVGYGTEYEIDTDSWTVILNKAIEEGGSVRVVYSTYEYDFAAQLAGFCATVTAKNNQILGIMSVTPPASADLGDIKDYVDSQETQLHNQFLQVVGGPTQFFEINNQPYESDFSGAYAGLVSLLPSYSAPTNKVVPGALFPSFSLSPSQIKTLTNKHIVVPRMRNGRTVIADAVTTAPDKSDFVRLTTVRITNDAVQLIREICEPYIGEPNTLPRRNALETQIDAALKGMIKRGALNDYRFSVKASLADQLDGNMRIALDLVPVFETRRIFITVALKPSL